MKNSVVVGVDEVGRGCLFGPVVAAAFSFCPGKKIPQGLTDSKKLTPKKRSELSELLYKEGHFISVAECSPEEIDMYNILNASLFAMKKAIESLSEHMSFESVDIKVDGNQRVPNLNPNWNQETIVKGDLKNQSIAAASIIAKVYRDKKIEDMEKEYPGYGLSKHKGYPTKAHKEAIQRLGVTIQHRKSFKGVSEHL